MMGCSVLKLSSVLILIAIAAVHATNFAEKKRDLPNEVDDFRSLLPRPTLECLWEPVSMKQRCQTKTAGVQLTRLGTGVYSFQTTQTLNWYAARNWCRARGMDLVTVDSAAEDQLLVNYQYNYYVTNGIALNPTVSTNFFWTGLNDLGSPRFSFSWVATGQPLGGYTNWSPTQPSQPATGPIENCGEYMYRDAPRPAWNDRDCFALGRFICEVNLPCKCYV